MPEANTLPETKTFPCPICKDEVIESRGHAAGGCGWCQDGTVTIDPQAIKAALISAKGRTKNRFRRSRPALPPEGVFGAAYVWRMIRFHTAADMMMPVAAMLYVGLPSEEIIAALDEATERLGAEMFGKAVMLRGAARWAGALTGDYRAADLLGVVRGSIGSDIGGIEESPEYWTERPADELAEELSAPPATDD